MGNSHFGPGHLGVPSWPNEGVHQQMSGGSGAASILEVLMLLQQRVWQMNGRVLRTATVTSATVSIADAAKAAVIELTADAEAITKYAEAIGQKGKSTTTNPDHNNNNGTPRNLNNNNNGTSKARSSNTAVGLVHTWTLVSPRRKKIGKATAANPDNNYRGTLKDPNNNNNNGPPEARSSNTVGGLVHNSGIVLSCVASMETPTTMPPKDTAAISNNNNTTIGTMAYSARATADGSSHPAGPVPTKTRGSDTVATADGARGSDTVAAADGAREGVKTPATPADEAVVAIAMSPASTATATTRHKKNAAKAATNPLTGDDAVNPSNNNNTGPEKVTAVEQHWALVPPSPPAK